MPILRKRFFGGGAVEVSVSNADFFRCWRLEQFTPCNASVGGANAASRSVRGNQNAFICFHHLASSLDTPTTAKQLWSRRQPSIRRWQM